MVTTVQTVRGSKLGRGKRIFSKPKRPDQLRGTPNLLFSGYRVYSGQSPPSSYEVKNEWSYNSTPSIRSHGVYRDNFTSFIPLFRPMQLKRSRTVRYINTQVTPIVKLCTGLYSPWGFQEVEDPRFPGNRHKNIVRLPDLRTGRLYPTRK
jgi:hypothetical protein